MTGTYEGTFFLFDSTGKSESYSLTFNLTCGNGNDTNSSSSSSSSEIAEVEPEWLTLAREFAFKKGLDWVEPEVPKPTLQKFTTDGLIVL